CVECYLDEHCGDSEICDREEFVCRSVTGRGLCEVCTEDSQCGQAADLCLPFPGEGGEIVDHGCGRACSDGQPCPPGYRCISLGNINQCVPHNEEPIVTCAGIRAMGESCGGIGANCGIEGVQDGTCQFQISGSYCSVRCDGSGSVNESMCIEGWICSGWPTFFFCQVEE
ncbi:MAG: hypothetical protein JRJ19_12995, partial [Deltaproteobacteria bacterium]|nr:hypothetical protein [Deltaproteobacteria bacterium]